MSETTNIHIPLKNQNITEDFIFENINPLLKSFYDIESMNEQKLINRAKPIIALIKILNINLDYNENINIKEYNYDEYINKYINVSYSKSNYNQNNPKHNEAIKRRVNLIKQIYKSNTLDNQLSESVSKIQNIVNQSEIDAHQAITIIKEALEFILAHQKNIAYILDVNDRLNKKFIKNIYNKDNIPRKKILNIINIINKEFKTEIENIIKVYKINNQISKYVQIKNTLNTHSNNLENLKNIIKEYETKEQEMKDIIKDYANPEHLNIPQNKESAEIIINLDNNVSLIASTNTDSYDKEIDIYLKDNNGNYQDIARISPRESCYSDDSKYNVCYITAKIYEDYLMDGWTELFHIPNALE